MESILDLQFISEVFLLINFIAKLEQDVKSQKNAKININISHNSSKKIASKVQNIEVFLIERLFINDQHNKERI